jgi:hypothetical protein
MAAKGTTVQGKNYSNFLQELKERIRRVQVKSALSVNQEFVLLYWQIGREILARQAVV